MGRKTCGKEDWTHQSRSLAHFHQGQNLQCVEQEWQEARQLLRWKRERTCEKEEQVCEKNEKEVVLGEHFQEEAVIVQEECVLELLES